MIRLLFYSNFRAGKFCYSCKPAWICIFFLGFFSSSVKWSETSGWQPEKFMCDSAVGFVCGRDLTAVLFHSDALFNFDIKKNLITTHIDVFSPPPLLLFYTRQVLDLFINIVGSYRRSLFKNRFCTHFYVLTIKWPHSLIYNPYLLCTALKLPPQIFTTVINSLFIFNKNY